MNMNTYSHLGGCLTTNVFFVHNKCKYSSDRVNQAKTPEQGLNPNLRWRQIHFQAKEQPSVENTGVDLDLGHLIDKVLRLQKFD